ncbi:MAG: MurR/RpiR family transcriptional regulator [Peptoniphilaceae bacterium]|nr:MurR/RpiR family transcriptional regulator [Peptoniphilaceae bacterium]
MDVSVVTLIESKSEQFTASDATIAKFFLETALDKDSDLSSEFISKKLFVSESALTRFAKKLGFAGYREFVYELKKLNSGVSSRFRRLQTPVFDTYQELLTKSEHLFQFDEIASVVDHILRSRKLFVYGMGSSGLIGEEFCQRLVRLGFDAECVHDAHRLSFNHVRLTEESVVIGISYSGTTHEVVDALLEAKKKNATTILLVSVNDPILFDQFDSVLLLPVKKNLDYSNIISPQFPAMILLDLIYGLILHSSEETKKNFNQAISDLMRSVRGKEWEGE